jgi:uncharacterized phiE125 gp8 family phage protein
LKSKVTVQPATEPITLTEVKDSLRITTTAQDTFLTQCITDARIYAENYTGRKFITQTIVGYADNFTGNRDNWFTGFRQGSELDLYAKGERKITLDWAPVSSVSQVDTVDIDNTETVYASSNYYLDNYDDDMKPSIQVNDNTTIINISLRSQNAIKVTYIAGYGANASDVPPAIRRGLIMLVGHLYTNRGDCDGDCVTKSGANQYLDQYKLESVSISI